MSDTDIEMIEETNRAVFRQWCIDKGYLTRMESTVKELVDFMKDKHGREYENEIAHVLGEIEGGESCHLQ